MSGIGRQGEGRLIIAEARWFAIAVGAVDVLARLVAVAAVDQAAGPHADGIAFEDAAFDGERDFGPVLRADDRFELVLRDVVRELAAFQLGGERGTRHNEREC